LKNTGRRQNIVIKTPEKLAGRSRQLRPFNPTVEGQSGCLIMTDYGFSHGIIIEKSGNYVFYCCNNNGWFFATKPSTGDKYQKICFSFGRICSENQIGVDLVLGPNLRKKNKF
jgi:hypothetical protein